MTTAFCSNDNHHGHAAPLHPERPERIVELLSHLKQQAIWEVMDHVAPGVAGRAEAQLVHTAAYLDRLETATAYAARLDADTYTTHKSLAAAYGSLGSALAVTDAVLQGQAQNGFSAGRPPGHHATPTQAMGFCLLNNAAVAARWAQRSHGLSRIAILDFDVHHGNGTQDAFFDDPNVLYMSVHQSPLYPGTGALTETGVNGCNVNLPLPAGAGDAALVASFERIFEPVIDRFKPELIIASAGYDAHWRDPLAGLRATEEGFAKLTRLLLTWAEAVCSGRLVFLLEGGYDLEALQSSVTQTLLVLTGTGDLDSGPQQTAVLGAESEGVENQLVGAVERALAEAEQVHLGRSRSRSGGGGGG